MEDRDYGYSSNVASAAELTKGGTFKGGKKVKSVDWLRTEPNGDPKNQAPIKTGEALK